MKKFVHSDMVYLDVLHSAIRAFVIANNGWETVEDIARRIFARRFGMTYPQNHPPTINHDMPSWFAEYVYHLEWWAYGILKFGYGVRSKPNISELSGDLCSVGVCSAPTLCLGQAFRLLISIEKTKKLLATQRLLAEAEGSSRLAEDQKHGQLSIFWEEKK